LIPWAITPIAACCPWASSTRPLQANRTGRRIRPIHVPNV
jgi:hypothetical protein